MNFNGKRFCDSTQLARASDSNSNQEIDDLNALRQVHAGKFVNCLLFEIYQNYGKSPKDEQRSKQ